MARIELFDRYYLGVADGCYTLYREPITPRYDKAHKPISPPAMAYYSTLYDAIRGFKRRVVIDRLQEHDQLSLEEAVRVLRDTDAELTSLLKDINA